MPRLQSFFDLLCRSYLNGRVAPALHSPAARCLLVLSRIENHHALHSRRSTPTRRPSIREISRFSTDPRLDIATLSVCSCAVSDPFDLHQRVLNKHTEVIRARVDVG